MYANTIKRNQHSVEDGIFYWPGEETVGNKGFMPSFMQDNFSFRDTSNIPPWIWPIVFMCAISGGLILIGGIIWFMEGGGKQELVITSSETRVFSFNSYLYSEVSLIDKDGTLSTYQFNKFPDLLKEERFKVTEQILLPSNHYQYWSRYLNQGSHISITSTIESEKVLTLCIIESTDEYETWKKTGVCEIKSQGNRQISYQFTAMSDNQYYIILGNDEVHTTINLLENSTLASHSEVEEENNYHSTNESEYTFAKGNITFTLDLLIHDFTYAIDVFRGSFVKEFQIGTNEWFVLFNPSKLQTLSIRIELKWRINLAIIIFFITELFGLLCCCCYYFISGESNREKKKKQGKQYPGISYDNHVYRKKRSADIRLFIPSQTEPKLEEIVEDPQVDSWQGSPEDIFSTERRETIYTPDIGGISSGVKKIMSISSRHKAV